MKLNLLDNLYAVCRLAGVNAVPAWASGELVAIVQETNASTVVCLQANIPDDVVSEKDWRVIKVAGPLDFNLVGILSELAGILADANISIFAISTFDTDYLLVKSGRLGEATAALETHGHRFV